MSVKFSLRHQMVRFYFKIIIFRHLLPLLSFRSHHCGTSATSTHQSLLHFFLSHWTNINKSIMPVFQPGTQRDWTCVSLIAVPRFLPIFCVHENVDLTFGTGFWPFFFPCCSAADSGEEGGSLEETGEFQEERWSAGWPAHEVKGMDSSSQRDCLSRDGFGFWGHAWSVLGLNRARSVLKFFWVLQWFYNAQSVHF